jgi:hypothetical protein
VIYLDAVVPEGGKSLFEQNGPVFASFVEESARQHGDGSGWPIPPSEILSTYISIDGIDEAGLRWFYGKATPHPIGTLKQPITLTGAAWSTVGRTYVFCTSERSEDAVKAVQTLRDNGWGYRELDTGHWPMFSMPDRLANLLLELVAG